jgi:hypothetical protein
MSAFDPKRTFHLFKRTSGIGTMRRGRPLMRRCEYTKLVKTVPIWSGLARTFLAGALSIAFHATGYSEEAKKPIHIGVISFAEPALRTSLDQSLVQGLREQGLR